MAYAKELKTYKKQTNTLFDELTSLSKKEEKLVSDSAACQEEILALEKRIAEIQEDLTSVRSDKLEVAQQLFSQLELIKNSVSDLLPPEESTTELI